MPRPGEPEGCGVLADRRSAAAPVPRLDAGAPVANVAAAAAIFLRGIGLVGAWMRNGLMMMIALAFALGACCWCCGGGRREYRVPQPLRLPPGDLAVVSGVQEFDVDGELDVSVVAVVAGEELGEFRVGAPGVGEVGGDLVHDERVGAEGGQERGDEALDAVGVDEGGEGREGGV